MATLSSINSSEIGREVRCGGEYRGMAREGRRAEEKEKRDHMPACSSHWGEHSISYGQNQDIHTEKVDRKQDLIVKLCQKL